jgi:hypothetical protein
MLSLDFPVCALEPFNTSQVAISRYLRQRATRMRDGLTTSDLFSAAAKSLPLIMVKPLAETCLLPFANFYPREPHGDWPIRNISLFVS